MTGPVFSGQAAEVSALCACVDAYVALGDVGGAGFTMGKTWETNRKTPKMDGLQWRCSTENHLMS